MQTQCSGTRIYVFNDNPPDRLKPEEINQGHLSGGDSRDDDFVHLYPLGTGFDSLDERVFVLADLLEFT